MGATFDGAAVSAVMAAVKSVPKSLASYEAVLFHEPKAAPVSLPALALWAGPIEPIGAVSGLAEVSGRVSVQGRIYVANALNASDKAEELLLTLTSELLGAFAGAFTLGGSVMFMDLLGAYGQKLSAVPGFLPHDAAFFRVCECAFPVIIDPLWTETP